MTAVLTLTSSLQAMSGSLQRRWDASKATVGHIKQIASDPQAAQINLMRHQQTYLPPGKMQEKAFKSRPQSYK